MKKSVKKLISWAVSFILALGVCIIVPAAVSEKLFAEFNVYAADNVLPAPEYFCDGPWGCTDGSVTLEWSAVKGASGYSLYSYDSVSKKYKVFKSNIKDTKITITGLKEGKDHIFKVAAEKKAKGTTTAGTLSKAVTVRWDNQVYSGPQKVTIPEKVRYVDFKITENIQTAYLYGDTAKRAENFVKKLKYYDLAMIHADELRSSEDYSKCKRYFDKKGKIQPKASGVFTYDYDGDNKKESFVIVDIPLCNSYSFDNKEYTEVRIWSLLLFCDKNNNMTYMDYYDSGAPRQNIKYDNDVYLIDYGSYKHIFIGGGTGASDHREIYGVVNGKPKEFLSFRGFPSKAGCFLRTDAFFGTGAIYCYDNINGRYVGITGKKVSMSKLRKMDSTNVLKSFEDIESAYIFSGKYYIIDTFPDEDVYIYENGKFKRADDTGFRMYAPYGDDMYCTEDVDIDKAMEKMEEI